MPPTTLNSEEPHNPTRRTQNDYTTPQDLTETKLSGTLQHLKAQVKALSSYSHSVVIVLPSRHSSCTQFSAASRSECR